MESERRTNIIGAELDDSRLSDILSASQIKVTDTYETPPQIIWIDNSTIATLGNFSASTGKAKSKKTFNVSAIVAASLAGKQVLNYRAHLPEGKQRILYVDTEQSRFHCHNVLERILKLAGLPDTTDNDRLDFICLREYSPAIRIEVIDYALRRSKGYGLVVIDGIRDLMLDINSTSESVEVINKMMEWSSKYDLHIHCVLHLNKGDNNVRGHIGTEMSNKAETVLVINKDNENPSISEVHALHIREKEFKPFAFTIDEAGLPIIGPRLDRVARPAFPLGRRPFVVRQRVVAAVQHPLLRRSREPVRLVDDRCAVRLLVYQLPADGFVAAPDGRYEVYDGLSDAGDDAPVVQQLFERSDLLLLPGQHSHDRTDARDPPDDRR